MPSVEETLEKYPLTTDTLFHIFRTILYVIKSFVTFLFPRFCCRNMPKKILLLNASEKWAKKLSTKLTVGMPEQRQILLRASKQAQISSSFLFGEWTDAPKQKSVSLIT